MRNQRELWSFLNTGTPVHYRQEDLSILLRRKGLSASELRVLSDAPLFSENGEKVYFQRRDRLLYYDAYFNEYVRTVYDHLIRQDAAICIHLKRNGIDRTSAVVSPAELQRLHVCRECGCYYDVEDNGSHLCPHCREHIPPEILEEESDEEEMFECPICSNRRKIRGSLRILLSGKEERICPSCLGVMVGERYAREVTTSLLRPKSTMFKMINDDLWFDRNYVNDSILPYHGFHGRYEPQAIEGEETSAYYGIEIESKGSDTNAAYIRHHFGDIFNCQRDASVNGGFEAISQPRSLNWWYSYYPTLKTMCDTISNNGQMGHDALGCGLHIHVSRRAFKDPSCIRRAILIVHKFKEQMEWLSRRKSGSYYNYYPYDGDPSDFIFEERIISRGHDCAVNNANEKTVEFRMFRSTLKASTIIASIELVHNIVEIANSQCPEFAFETLIRNGTYLPSYAQSRMNEAPDLNASISFRAMYPSESALWDSRRNEVIESSAQLFSEASEIERQIQSQRSRLEAIEALQNEQMMLWNILPEELLRAGGIA